MPWQSMEPPLVPGLDVEEPFNAKRFFTTPLLSLVSDVFGYVKRFMKQRGIDSPEKAIRFVIEEIDYPLNILGMDDDSHYLVAFGGKFIAAVTRDYWSADYETLNTFTINSRIGRHGLGDCEDTSLLLCSMLQELGIECYTIFGLVYEYGVLLGGHAYVIANLPNYGWALIETTLDKAPPYPNGWPKVDPNLNCYTVGALTYTALLRFNRRVYEEWVDMKQTNVSKHGGFNAYRHARSDRFDEKIKLQAIERSWGIPTKLRRYEKEEK